MLPRLPGRSFEIHIFIIMLPQPPPDVPAPPPSEAALVSQRKWKWLWAIGGGTILLILLFGLLGPLLFVSRKYADTTEAVNNARQIGLALLEFQAAYGKFPDADTAAEVRLRTKTTLDLSGSSSNAFFRQLYYSKVKGTRKPDNNYSRAEALKKMECGFTYFLGAKPTDNPRRPLLVTPMIPGTDRFEGMRDSKRVVVLRLDNSVTSHRIDKNGHVLIDGRNMMDPHHPIWDGHAPVIAWPEF
jgi:type II secretory pathway pseudopilin PulG